MSNNNQSRDTCTSCGVPFVGHKGIILTCAELQKARAECAAKEQEIQRVWSNYQACRLAGMELVALFSHVRCFLPTFAQAEADKVCEKFNSLGGK